MTRKVPSPHTSRITPLRSAHLSPAAEADKDFLVPGTPDELLSLLVEGATDYAMILTDSEQRVVRWSAGAEHLLGWPESDVLGQPVDLIFTPEDREAGEPAREAGEARSAGKASDERWHIRRDGTRFWGSGMIRPLHDESGHLRGYAKVLRNATRQHLADASAAEDRRITLALQRSLLATLEPHAFPGLQVAAVYEPASDEALVGGDFYDVFAIANERVVLVVGDVTGKGLLAATYMAEVKFALRAFLRESSDPAYALKRLNHFLLEGKRLDTRPHEEFVGLSLAVLETATGQVECSWAGMYPPLLINAEGAKDAEEEAFMSVLSGEGAPFLCIAEDTEFVIVKADLAPGELLLITTDGITEARRGARTPFFGMEGVIDVVKAGSRFRGGVSGSSKYKPSSPMEPENLGRAVVEGARTFAGGVLNDDVCLVIVRRLPAPPVSVSP